MLIKDRRPSNFLRRCKTGVFVLGVVGILKEPADEIDLIDRPILALLTGVKCD